MRSEKTLFTVESHTMGEPLRCVVGGAPQLAGKTVMEKKEYFREHYDYLRQAIMLEPRGHKDMFGSILRVQHGEFRADDIRLGAAPLQVAPLH